MPLKSGDSAETISSNIRELTLHGSKPRPKKQIIAIAYANARKTGGGKKKPGIPRKPPEVKVAGQHRPKGVVLMHASGASGADEG